MAKFIYFTPEEKARAQNTDLVSLLRAQGERPIRSGREYRIPIYKTFLQLFGNSVGVFITTSQPDSKGELPAKWSVRAVKAGKAYRGQEVRRRSERRERACKRSVGLRA